MCRDPGLVACRGPCRAGDVLFRLGRRRAESPTRQVDLADRFVVVEEQGTIPMDRASTVAVMVIELGRLVAKLAMCRTRS